MRLMTLKKREEFVRIAQQGEKLATPTFVLQFLPQAGSEQVRVGFTVTKKIGNAVVRNRIKRRLREACRALLSQYGLPGHDYVFIGRSKTERCEFSAIVKDMTRTLQGLRARKG